MASEAADAGDQPYDDRVVVDLVPVLRRVVGARIKDPYTVEDLVQETLARLMSSARRVDPDKLHHYAAVTARHVVASYAERNDRARNRSHLLGGPADVPPPVDDGVVRVPVARDADVVTARQQGREVAARAGFSTSDQTLIATAISEISRNIVKFAERGEVTISLVTDEGRRGVRVEARDVGPGIPDIEAALRDGFSTYHGLGLGLPGAKRLMDRFHLSSVAGEGTTVTMEKWLT